MASIDFMKAKIFLFGASSENHAKYAWLKPPDKEHSKPKQTDDFAKFTVTNI